MPHEPSRRATAFVGQRQLASGALIDVALKVKAAEEDDGDAVLVFDDATGTVVDLDLRGSPADIAARLEAASAPATVDSPATAAKATRRPRADGASRGRGRPKLGVVAREVTLLPRHWDWLADQPGGASQVLRRLVEEARKADGGERRAREAAYRFLTAVAGDLPGYEEAIRALFIASEEKFAARMAGWPADVRRHALKLAGYAAGADDDAA